MPSVHRRFEVRRAVHLTCAVRSELWDGPAPFLATDLSASGLRLCSPLALPPSSTAWLATLATLVCGGLVMTTKVKIVAAAVVAIAAGIAWWFADSRDAMGDAFAKGKTADGLTQAICEVGSRLALHFPRGGGDRNELSDEVSYR